MPTGVDIVDLADAIASDLAAVNALPVPVSVTLTFDPKAYLKTLEAATTPLVTIVPRTEIEDFEARGVEWETSREIDIAVRFKLRGPTDNDLSTEVVAGIRLLKAIGKYYRSRRPTGRTEDLTLATYPTLWSPTDFTINRIYFGVVRLTFTPEVEEDDE